MTREHNGREAKRTTQRARDASAQDDSLKRSTGFKPRPRLGREQRGLPSDAVLVHRVRMHKRWTQERLGAELGVTRSTISRWEAGLMPPPILYVVAMASLLDVA